MALSFQRNQRKTCVEYGISSVALQIHPKTVVSSITKIQLKFTKTSLKMYVLDANSLWQQEDWQPGWPQRCFLYFTLPLARNPLDGTKQENNDLRIH